MRRVITAFNDARDYDCDTALVRDMIESNVFHAPPATDLKIVRFDGCVVSGDVTLELLKCLADKASEARILALLEALRNELVANRQVVEVNGRYALYLDDESGVDLDHLKVA